MRYWIKLYTEIVHDPKMGRLTDRQFRTCINLFAMAGNLDQEGALPPRDDIAWQLRMIHDELDADLQELEHVGIIELRENGWYVRKWQERQSRAPSDAPERVLQRVHDYRQRQRNEVVTSLHSDVTSLQRGVTPSEAEKRRSREEAETEAEAETAQTAATAVAVKAYENVCGLISGKDQRDEILAAIDDLTEIGHSEWWFAALREAENNNARKWAYVRSIISRCLRDGSAPGSKPSNRRNGSEPGESKADATIRIAREIEAREETARGKQGL